MEGNWYSGVAQAISWNDSKKERKGKFLSLLVASAISVAVMSPGMRTSMAEAGDQMVSVIVRALPGGANEAARAVEAAGGTIGRDLDIINGFEASMPRSEMMQLESDPFVYELTMNGKLHFLQTTTEPIAPVSMETVNAMAGSMYKTAKVTGADKYYAHGYEGQGVDVALIDTGVIPTDGLPANRIINGPDLSFESQYPETQYLDTMGHGTHMAGIIAGDDMPGTFSSSEFQGMAPRSRIVSVKVGQADGAADVSQVLAAIDWVVQNRNANGMNIRVLSLSFGTDGTQSYLLDPLTFAVENAWHKGIVVVVAGGNAGYGSTKLNNPAYDPYVLAIGADDSKGTYGVEDDSVPDWSSRGNAERRPDLVTPGQSIVSLRNEGALIDESYPTAQVGTRFFKGSGTSQSAAVASGAAALMLSHRPYLTPDQVKYLMTKTARVLPNTDPLAQGAGLLSLDRAYASNVPGSSSSNVRQSFPRATGTGLLELSRGSAIVADEDANDDGVADDPVELRGEIDIHGMPFDSKAWALLSGLGTSWSGGFWNGTEWTGSCFCADSWSGKSWSGKSWSGKSWSGKSWSGKSWSGKSWSGKSWSGLSWSGKSWSGKSWSGKSWSGKSWSGYTYD
jgi:hypothetical protein